MEEITLTEFQKRLGLNSRSTIHQAIQTGKLRESVKKFKGVWKVIDFDLALEEWAMAFRFDDSRVSPQLRAKLKRIRDRLVKEGKAEAPEDGRVAHLKSMGKVKGNIPPKAVSDAILAAVKAKKEKIELDRLMGSLVERAEIDRALFGAGQEIREAFLGIPDRVIDSILASGTRAEAHNLLMEAIAQTLERLANPADLVNTKLKTV